MKNLYLSVIILMMVWAAMGGPSYEWFKDEPVNYLLPQLKLF